MSSGLLELRRNSLCTNSVCSLRLVLTESVYPAYVAYSKDEDYLDLRGLQALARTEYREDIVNGNLADYIVRGAHTNSNHTYQNCDRDSYFKATRALANVSDMP